MYVQNRNRIQFRHFDGIDLCRAAGILFDLRHFPGQVVFLHGNLNRHVYINAVVCGLQRHGIQRVIGVDLYVSHNRCKFCSVYLYGRKLFFLSHKFFFAPVHRHFALIDLRECFADSCFYAVLLNPVGISRR